MNVDSPDGEFWMSFDDFYRNFETVQICSLSPDAYSDELGDKNPNLSLRWNLTTYHGQWKSGVSAGGNGQPDKNAYWTNPQFLIKLTDVDPTDDENMATVIISLMQKYTRQKRSETGGDSAEQSVQFRLYKVKNADDALKAKTAGHKLHVNQLETALTSGSYLNLRDITKRFRIPSGDYVIIPSCWDKNVEGEFLLRVFSEQEINASNCQDLNVDDNPTENDSQNSDNNKNDDNDDGKGKRFGDWNDLLDTDIYRPKPQWKSSYTTKLLGSREFRFPHLSNRRTTLSIFDRILVR